MVSLDLLSGVVQGLGADANELIALPTEPSFFTLLKVSMKDEVSDIRSSAFALLGDLCIAAFPLVVPHLNEIMQLAVANLSMPLDSQNISAMNNAAWSSGEIAMQHCKFFMITPDSSTYGALCQSIDFQTDSNLVEPRNSSILERKFSNHYRKTWFCMSSIVGSPSRSICPEMV